MKMIYGLVAILFLVGCSLGECTNLNYGRCDVVGKIVDFDIEMAGTGIGIGAQLHQKATVTLENGKKFVIDEDNLINELSTDSYYMKCGECYGTGYYYDIIKD